MGGIVRVAAASQIASKHEFEALSSRVVAAAFLDSCLTFGLALYQNLFQGRAKGDAPKREPNLGFPAVFCENLRFPAKICGFLRFPAPSKCWNFQEKGICENLRKFCENLRFGLSLSP